MMILRIAVEWLAGRYHGAEWPPSPRRLYAAMVAGSAALGRGAPEPEAALRHLETLAPPVITAPRAALHGPVTARAANNDGDLVVALAAQGEGDAARELERTLVTRRTRRARTFAGSVVYDYEASAGTVEHVPALARIARSVPAVGHAIDLALLRAELLECPSKAPGVRYTPSQGGRLALQAPSPGSFDGLEARWRQERSRIGQNRIGIGGEAAFRTVWYHTGLELPPRRWEAFSLRTRAGGVVAIDGTRAMEVAAMVRHAIGCAAKSAGLGRGVISELMGHDGEGRISVQPLVNVGYRDADGRIRRVLLVAPQCVGEDVWWSVVSQLRGAPLVAAGWGAEVGLLASLSRPDPVLERYIGRSRLWTSATPVVLAGFDSRRGRVRPGRAVRRLLRHAGVAEELLESVRLEPGARLRGSAHPLSCRRPGHLARYPCVHLTIGWTAPVRGPLALGAGVGYGLGLFVPARGDFPGRGRGDVEGS